MGVPRISSHTPEAKFISSSQPASTPLLVSGSLAKRHATALVPGGMLKTKTRQSVSPDSRLGCIAPFMKRSRKSKLVSDEALDQYVRRPGPTNVLPSQDSPESPI